MKILTLNTHSWMEDNPLEKLEALSENIAQQKFDVIALQEVNQTMAKAPVSRKDLRRYVETEATVRIKSDNFAFLLVQSLRAKGLDYYWTWVPSHIGYDTFDEGLALLSRKPIDDTRSFFASKSKDFYEIKARKVLGIQTGGEWFFSLHLGWWLDEEEPFHEQWARCEAVFSGLKGRVFLCGDFNNAAHIEGEGYDLVAQNWYDTYDLAEAKDEGCTIDENIDGWSDNSSGLRIDYIFCNQPVPVQSSKVVFDGETGPIVSDHFGVTVEL